MHRYVVIFFLTLSILLGVDLVKWKNQIKHLSDDEKSVIIYKATEPPYTGIYSNTFEPGVYRCKLCNTPLFMSENKFKSSCGWPSFDEAIKGAVVSVKDKDGYRNEILCSHCGAHLGHVFIGEHLTNKNVRYCVNSLSVSLEKKNISVSNGVKKAYFSGGCFWGVEYYMEKLKGVAHVESGYMGGHAKNPTYNDVSQGNTGYYETVEVVYNPNIISYDSLVRYFLEIHDPTQINGQGPDIGPQYRSAIFVQNEQERHIANALLNKLRQNNFHVATKVIPFSPFYKAESYHQNYYQNKGTQPYCHTYIKRF